MKRMGLGIGLAAMLAILALTTAPVSAQVINNPILSPGANQAQGQGQEQLQLQEQQQLQAQQALNSQGVSINSYGVPLIQVPGLIGAYPNYTQPYKPDAFLSGAAGMRPVRITRAEAENCADGLGFWGVKSDTYGRSDRKAVDQIDLFYPVWDKDKFQPATSLKGYVATVRMEAKDKPWLPVLCKSVLTLMDRGAKIGMVTYITKGINHVSGVMLSASFGGSGQPGAGANPYQFTGAIGGGIGWSDAEVREKVVVQVEGVDDGKMIKASREDEPSVKPVSLPVPSVRPMSFETPATPAIQGQ